MKNVWLMALLSTLYSLRGVLVFVLGFIVAGFYGFGGLLLYMALVFVTRLYITEVQKLKGGK